MKQAVLIGPPNCGKSTLFRLLTGKHVPTGNRAGVTVEASMAPIPDTDWQLTDLPGIRSANPSSADEEVTVQTLASVQPDLVLAVADATALAAQYPILLALHDRYFSANCFAFKRVRRAGAPHFGKCTTTLFAGCDPAAFRTDGNGDRCTARIASVAGAVADRGFFAAGTPFGTIATGRWRFKSADTHRGAMGSLALAPDLGLFDLCIGQRNDLMVDLWCGWQLFDRPLLCALPVATLCACAAACVAGMVARFADRWAVGRRWRRAGIFTANVVAVFVADLFGAIRLSCPCRKAL